MKCEETLKGRLNYFKQIKPKQQVMKLDKEAAIMQNEMVQKLAGGQKTPEYQQKQEQGMKNDYEILDHLTETAFSFIPSYLEFLEQANRKRTNLDQAEAEAISFNEYMKEMRKRVTEDLQVIDKEYFPPGLRSRGSRRVNRMLQPVHESMNTGRNSSQLQSVEEPHSPTMKSSVRTSSVAKFHTEDEILC